MMHIDHVNIVVSDMDRSVRFYTEVLGFTETRRAFLEGDWIEAVVGLVDVKADVVYVQPPGGGPRIELIQYHAPAGATLPECTRPNTVGLRHIAFQVDDMETAVARLTAAGVECIGPPVSVPKGVVTHDDGHKWLVYHQF